MSGRREKAAFVCVVVVGALLGFLAASRPWVEAFVPDPVAERTLQASGRQAAGAVPAVALVALAGAVAVLSTRRLGQSVAGGLLVLAGAAAAATSVGVLRTPARAVEQVVTAATGRTRVTDVTASVTSWPWLGVASGALVALGGCLAVVRARSWAGLPARYDTGRQGHEPAGDNGAGGSNGAAGDPGLAWDAMSRGEDPTR